MYLNFLFLFSLLFAGIDLQAKQENKEKSTYEIIQDHAQAREVLKQFFPLNVEKSTKPYAIGNRTTIETVYTTFYETEEEKVALENYKSAALALDQKLMARFRIDVATGIFILFLSGLVSKSTAGKKIPILNVAYDWAHLLVGYMVAEYIQLRRLEEQAIEGYSTFTFEPRKYESFPLAQSFILTLCAFPAFVCGRGIVNNLMN